MSSRSVVSRIAIFATSLAIAAMALMLSTAGASAAPVGSVTEFSAGLSSGSEPVGIALGANGNMWFTDQGSTPAIGEITPTGAITEFAAGLGGGASPLDIAAGPDGGMWFTDPGTTPAIGEIAPSGAITEHSTGLAVGAKPVL